MEKYEVIENIGKGSYGTVYKAIKIETCQTVALKKVRLIEDEGVSGSLMREISILKELKHENIVILHDIIHQETHITLVLEYFEQDLKKYLRAYGHQIEPATTRSFMLQLMKGLAFCHSKKLYIVT